jgi:hypothetical protein
MVTAVSVSALMAFAGMLYGPAALHFLSFAIVLKVPDLWFRWFVTVDG